MYSTLKVAKNVKTPKAHGSAKVNAFESNSKIVCKNGNL